MLSVYARRAGEGMRGAPLLNEKWLLSSVRAVPNCTQACSAISARAAPAAIAPHPVREWAAECRRTSFVNSTRKRSTESSCSLRTNKLASRRCARQRHTDRHAFVDGEARAV